MVCKDQSIQKFRLLHARRAPDECAVGSSTCALPFACSNAFPAARFRMIRTIIQKIFVISPTQATQRTGPG